MVLQKVPIIHRRDKRSRETKSEATHKSESRQTHKMALLLPATLEETKDALKVGRNNTAPTVVGIPSEILKRWSTGMTTKRHELLSTVNLCWKCGAKVTFALFTKKSNSDRYRRSFFAVSERFCAQSVRLPQQETVDQPTRHLPPPAPSKN